MSQVEWTPKLKMHYARGLPDRAICGADIRRGGFTSDGEIVTCVRCQRIRSAARPGGRFYTEEQKARRAELERARWAARKKLGLWILGGHCVVCGTNRRLEFDHRRPGCKSFALMEGTVSHSRWLRELRKCQLLCKTHHKIKSDWEELRGRRHATYGAYNSGCRCGRCVRWYARHRTRARD